MVIRCRAVQLIGKHEQKIDNSHVVITSRRSLEYHGAYLTRKDNICLYRIEPTKDKFIVRIKRRYVDLDQIVWLVPVRRRDSEVSG